MARTPGRHALVFVAVTVLLDVIGFGLILPVLLGNLSDRHGRRPVLLFAVSAPALTPRAPRHNMPCSIERP